MSLTRAQWVNMWESIKRIEALTKNLNYNAIKREQVRNEVDHIKGLIEQVIGQME